MKLSGTFVVVVVAARTDEEICSKTECYVFQPLQKENITLVIFYVSMYNNRCNMNNTLFIARHEFRINKRKIKISMYGMAGSI